MLSEEENMLSSDEESTESSTKSEEDSSSATEVGPRKHKLNNPSLNSNSKKFKPEERKNNKNSLHKPPTAEEFNRIKETENLFHSNLFRLQIDELLKEVNVKTKYKTKFSNWYQEFQWFLQDIPEYGKIPLYTMKKCRKPEPSKLQRFINALIIENTSGLKCDQEIVPNFIKPTECKVFGLYAINGTIGPLLNVDINVTIPKGCFFEKDFLNNRYFLKRVYYLLYIFVELKRTNLCASVECNFKNGTLKVVPNIHNKIIIHIHVTPSKDAFKPIRCQPSVNNVRELVFDAFRGMSTEQLIDKGTARYNALLGRDMTLVSNNDLLEKCLTSPNVQDAAKLLNLWLHQRNFQFSSRCDNDLVAYILFYLTLKKTISCNMSSYQVIRNFWIYLSTSNWHKEPISLCEDVSTETLKEYLEYFPVVFLDSSGYYNLASFLYLDVYMKVRKEAELAVKILDDFQFDSFRALFLTKMPAELQFDALVRLSSSDNFEKLYDSIDMKRKCTNYGCFEELILDEIISTLKIGLNKRVIYVIPISNEVNLQTSPSVILGITLNAAEAIKIIEKGPIANTAETGAFREYWGNLAECRRFADGTVCEAVYFDLKTMKDKRGIFKKMINSISENKLKIDKCQIVSDELEKVLVLPNFITPFCTGTAEEATLMIIAHFDRLTRIIRDFNLPLKVITIQSISDVVSFSAPFPPIPTNTKWGKRITKSKENNVVLNEHINMGMVPRFVEPIECVMRLSASAKWPKSLELIRNLKIEFYLQISKLLKQSKIISNVNPEFLQVFYKGIVFRFRIFHPKEVALLKMFRKPDGMVGYKDNDESFKMERDLHILPKLIGALNGIQSQNSSYGPSTALIKRWLRSQLMDEYHIPDIVVDLLNASLFIHGAPYSSASLPQVAFLRFLKYFSEFDFDSQFVVVNFNNCLDKEALHNIETDFSQNREKYPPLYIVTPYDNCKSLFSKQCIKYALNRLSELASGAYKIVQEDIASEHNIMRMMSLFQPNLAYDVVIHLKPFSNSKRYQSLKFTEDENENKMIVEEYDESKEQKIPVVGFNPVDKYLEELREHYGNFAVFFYDSYGGSVIGVLWRPEAFEVKNLKLSYMEGKKLVDGKLLLNQDAIIDDFRVLGNGLVKDIDREEF